MKIVIGIVLAILGLMTWSLARVTSEEDDSGEQDWKDKYLPENEEDEEFDETINLVDEEDEDE